MHKAKVVRRIAIAAALSGVAALFVQYLPTASVGAKPLSAPVFKGKNTAKAKVDVAFHFTIITKSNPVATAITETGALPLGVHFVDNGNGTATLSGTEPLSGSYSFSLDASNGISPDATETFTLNVTSKLPPIRHVFVIMLENNGYSATFGNPSADPYLATKLPSQGVLLKNYYGVGHFSNDNYVGFISGQPPNSQNQIDCLGSGYINFPPIDGQINGIQQGAGCVYPSAVTTLADQLTGEGLTWKGYEEDMGNDPTRDGGVTCGHPTVGATSDPTTAAEAADGYTTRHNPFMYFHSIIDNTAVCNQDVVPLGDTGGGMPAGTPAGGTGLVTDLGSVATTPNFSFITPNLCDDGHDSHCTNTTGAGQGGGSSVGDINKWLRAWVGFITSSPAFKQDGLLEITFDEAGTTDALACCGETPGPAANSGGNGLTGPGGGQVGAVLISPFIAPGTVVPKSASFNHYSSLASIEDLFGLPHLGEAQTVTTNFDKHVSTK